MWDILWLKAFVVRKKEPTSASPVKLIFFGLSPFYRIWKMYPSFIQKNTNHAIPSRSRNIIIICATERLRSWVFKMWYE